MQKQNNWNDKKRVEGGKKKSEFHQPKVKKHSLLKKDFVWSATVSSKTNYTVLNTNHTIIY